MAIVYLEQLDQARLRKNANGVTVTRTFLVDGVTGDITQTLWIAALLQGIPKWGDPHPSIAPLRCSDIEVSPLSPTQVKIVCTYIPPTYIFFPPDDKAPAQITVGATIQQQETNQDVNGNLMQVQYDQTDPSTGAVTTKTQTGTVEIQVPQVILKFSRKELNAPYNKALVYVGTINSAPFMGDPPGIWMCNRIEGTTKDGGQSYEVEYEFQRNPDTWFATVTYIDPTTNLVPNDIVDLYGIRSFVVYPSTDFNQLSLV